MEKKQTTRTSSASARAMLGLAPSPDRDLSVSVASADSADVAGGRAGSRPPVAMASSVSSASTRDGFSSRMVVPGLGLVEDTSHHHHPSRALWEGRATPSPSPTPLPPSAALTSSSARISGSSRPLLVSGSSIEAGGGWVAGGGSATDTFWSPVLPESDTAPPMDRGSLGEHWSWLQQQQQQQQQQEALQSEKGVITTQPAFAYGPVSPSQYKQQLAAAGIDRPALRGQEYRREKRWRWGSASAAARSTAERISNNSNNSHPTSSLMRSGSELDRQQRQQSTTEYTTTTSRRFLGIRWPSMLPGGRRDRSATTGDDDFSTRQGGGGELPVSGGEDARLQVSLEGAQELGKGLGGHTVYRLQVTDRAVGEQWMVLRRFRQFEALHRGLLPVLSREPDANAYVLPPKEVFGGRHGGVVAKRLKLLQVYLDRLVTCSAALEHRALSSFLELEPALRGLGAYGRHHGPECVLKEGRLWVRAWKGAYKPVINFVDAGLHLLGWISAHAIVSPGPVFLVYYGPEDDPEKPLWALPDKRTIGSQVRVRRVDMRKTDVEKDGNRFFLVSWEDTSLLCQVDSEASLDSWAHAIDETVDLRPQQSEEDRAKVDIELKAKEAWTTREEGLWGGL
ncbi:unnamed protein product [Ectocarpus sp. CCAP 1310/34]|nr:unnamed protein product [Ectocarpus sp. CCAP 1310/34]